MPSRHLLDPQFVALIEQFPEFELCAKRLGEVRAMMATRVPPAPPPPNDLQVREVRVPGRDGAPAVRLVVTAPKAAGRRRVGILHVHGGGYVLALPT